MEKVEDDEGYWKKLRMKVEIVEEEVHYEFEAVSPDGSMVPKCVGDEDAAGWAEVEGNRPDKQSCREKSRRSSVMETSMRVEKMVRERRGDL